MNLQRSAGSYYGEQRGVALHRACKRTITASFARKKNWYQFPQGPQRVTVKSQFLSRQKVPLHSWTLIVSHCALTAPIFVPECAGGSSFVFSQFFHDQN